MDDHRDSDEGAAPPEGQPLPRRFDAATPHEVSRLESTFGLDIDGDGHVGTAPAAAGDVPDHDTADVRVRRARPDAAPTPGAPPTPDAGGSPFVEDRVGARRWWPALVGIAIGVAMAYWYFYA